MELFGLDPRPFQTQKLKSLKAVRLVVQGHQGVMFYFHIGETTESILRDQNKKIVIPQASMRTENLSGLLPPIAARSREYFRFKGCLSAPASAAPSVYY